MTGATKDEGRDTRGDSNDPDVVDPYHQAQPAEGPTTPMAGPTPSGIHMTPWVTAIPAPTPTTPTTTPHPRSTPLPTHTPAPRRAPRRSPSPR